MARLARLYAPATVQHIVQRTLAGRALFDDGEDFALFTSLLQEAVRVHAVALHAYVLTPTEFRLLATPLQADSMSRLVQAIGRRYVPHMNRKTARDGPLWDRRYRSTLVDAAEFLLPAMRFVEQRPVALGLVTEPGAWPWSSCAHHVGMSQQPFISDHAGYWALSDTPFERQAIYRRLVMSPLPPAASERLSDAVERGWALGSPAFLATLQDVINRRASPLKRGRRRATSVQSVKWSVPK